MTVGDRVFEYVRQNPGARYLQVAEALGLSSVHARVTLSRLEKSGRLVAFDVGARARGYFPAGSRPSPFSVAVNQLLR